MTLPSTRQQTQLGTKLSRLSLFFVILALVLITSASADHNIGPVPRGEGQSLGCLCTCRAFDEADCDLTLVLYDRDGKQIESQSWSDLPDMAVRGILYEGPDNLISFDCDPTDPKADYNFEGAAVILDEDGEVVAYSQPD